MARPRNWDSLKPDYRRRLERGGITKSQYESGASLSGPRGHKATPEHGIRDAGKNPDKYQEYLRKRQPIEVGQRDTESLRRSVQSRMDELFSNEDKYSHLNMVENTSLMSRSQLLWANTASKGDIQYRARRDALRKVPDSLWYYH